MANRLNDLGKGKLEAPKLRPEIIIIRPDNNYRDMKSEATRAHIDNGGLTPTILEFGVAVQRLVNYGWEMEQVAKYIPTSIASTPVKALRFVRDALELHQAPLAVKEAVAHGVEGVSVSPALAVQATRKNRIFAADQINEVAKKAKADGKKVAKREKHAGKATKAKEATLSRTQQLEKIGDGMADNILKAKDGTYPPYLIGGARAWDQIRGR